MNLKMISITVIFVVMHFCRLAAQDAGKSGDSINGPLQLFGRAGLTFSSFKANGTSGFRFTTAAGFFAGIYAEYRKQSKIGLLGGLQYTEKGARVKPEEAVLYDHINYKLSYADVVLGAVFHPSPSLSFEAAFIPSFKVGEEIRYSAAYGIINGSAEANDIKATDMSVMAGFSIRPKVWKDALSIGANYTYGLTGIDKKSAESFSGLKNRTLSIYISYRIL